MLMKTMLILLFMFVSLSAFAQKPDSKSCNYYLKAEQEYKCGVEGYLAGTGYKMCQMYLDKEPTLSPKLKKWFPKIRLCLQKYIENNRGSIRDCSDLRVRAINSHVDCYRTTGYCDLDKKDIVKLAEMTGTKALHKDFIRLTLKLSTLCL